MFHYVIRPLMTDDDIAPGQKRFCDFVLLTRYILGADKNLFLFLEVTMLQFWNTDGLKTPVLKGRPFIPVSKRTRKKTWSYCLTRQREEFWELLLQHVQTIGSDRDCHVASYRIISCTSFIKLCVILLQLSNSFYHMTKYANRKWLISTRNPVLLRKRSSNAWLCFTWRIVKLRG